MTIQTLPERNCAKNCSRGPEDPKDSTSTHDFADLQEDLWLCAKEKAPHLSLTILFFIK